jgi:uncharacterized membrane protein YsdA (DUF1294 family)
MGNAIYIGLTWTLVFSILAFLLFGYDKGAAGSRGTRVPESVLLLVTLAGGWPGTLLAQRVFRHKTIKATFNRKLVMVVILSIATTVVIARTVFH